MREFADSEIRDELRAMLAASHELQGVGDDVLVDTFLSRSALSHRQAPPVVTIRKSVAAPTLIALTWAVALGGIAYRAWYYYVNDSDASGAYLQAIPVVLICACLVTALVLLARSCVRHVPTIRVEVKRRGSRSV
jgi:hypothetical protein